MGLLYEIAPKTLLLYLVLQIFVSFLFSLAEPDLKTNPVFGVLLYDCWLDRIFCISRISRSYLKSNMSKIGKDKTISIRLSQTMLEALDARAILDDKDRTQVIREAIAQYLELPEDSVEDRVNLLEQGIEKLHEQVQLTEERTDLLEMQFSELSRLVTMFIGRQKK
ncbi:CopG family ribbon-helix-helix protein [Nostoc favosum]|nr:ribbon-helix-helix protein, CopG family [Nostoc favosum]